MSLTGRRKSPGALWAVLLVLLGLLAVDASPTQATFSMATIKNDPNSNQLGYMGMWYAMDQGPVSGCSLAGSKPVSCDGYPVSPEPAAATSIRATGRVTNANKISTTLVRQQVRVVKCSPTQFTNSADGNANPMLPRSRVTRQVADPWGTTSAASFSGVNQFAGARLPITPYDMASVSYTLGAWFKLPLNSAGGPLLSLGPNPLNAAVGGVPANPVLYLGDNGDPRFVAQTAQGPESLTSPVRFRDNQWHFVAVSVDRSATTTISMYVDGQLVAARNNLPLLTGATGNYYWKIGWMDFPGLQGNSVNLNGSASGVFVARGAASAAQVSAMYRAGSASAYAAAIPDVRQLWMLGDDVTSTYDGTIPYVDSTGDPCTYLHLAWRIDGAEVMNGNALSVQETRGWLPPGGAPIKPVSQWSDSYNWIQRAGVYDADVTRMELLTVVEYRFLLSPNWTTTMSFDRMVLLA